MTKEITNVDTVYPLAKQLTIFIRLSNGLFLMRSKARIFLPFTVFLSLHYASADLIGMSAAAQYSPRCRMNGVEVFCAMTNYGQSKGIWRLTNVVLADGRKLNLRVNDETCRPTDNGSLCDAVITLNDREAVRTFKGSYHASRNEAGVQHHYSADNIDLVYVFMD